MRGVRTRHGRLSSNSNALSYAECMFMVPNPQDDIEDAFLVPPLVLVYHSIQICMQRLMLSCMIRDRRLLIAL